MKGFRGDPSFFRLHPSALVSTAAIFYILQILLQGKVASVELGAFIAIFCLGWAAARGEIRLSFHILYFPLLLHALASTISALVNGSPLTKYGEAMLWFKLLILPAALILFREVPRLRRLVLYAHAVFATYVSLWGLFEYMVLGHRTLDQRITGPTTHVMTFSGLLLPLSLLFLFLWLHERRPWQFAVCSLTTLTLLLTFTRSVWIGWAVATFAILAYTRPRLMFYALPALILFVTFMPMPLFTRLVSVFDTRQASNFDRLRMVEAGVEMIRDRPLVGIGPGKLKNEYPLYRKQDAPRPRPPHLHNNIIQLWAERGVLALASYIVLLALFLRECIRAWHGAGRRWAEAGVAVTVSLAVAGLFEFNWGDTEVMYLLLNLMALVIASIERPRPAPNEPQTSAVPALHTSMAGAS